MEKSSFRPGLSPFSAATLEHRSLGKIMIKRSLFGSWEAGKPKHMVPVSGTGLYVTSSYLRRQKVKGTRETTR
jgi:hypothetical protein